MKLYIAGPMRGYKYYNFPAFDAARDRLELKGIEVISPADADLDVGFDPFELPEDSDWNAIPENFDLDDCIRRDVNAVLECDGIYLLKGWEKSTGARAEKALAEWRGRKIFFEELPND